MPAIGTPAPDFTLPDTKKERITLSAFRGQRTVVLAFFPAAFTGTCEKELCTFRDSLAAFNDLDATVLGISVDAPFSNAAFAAKNALTFPLLSDYGRTAVRAYDVAHDDFAGLTGYTAAKRSVFVVDKQGNLVWSWVAPTPPTEPDYDEVRRAVTAANG